MKGEEEEEEEKKKNANAYRLLAGKLEWVDNIKMDIGEIGQGDVDWIDQA
jgi:hypothetical protein